ncbi:hypothetical protein ACQPZK_20945 [Micromonospora sp. CA-249363]|uniref:hypothetical protein n=1 Tax=Micromonospora sp. CA-249363 TaxID=3239963 RepID=UPI003D9212D2
MPGTPWLPIWWHARHRLVICSASDGLHMCRIEPGQPVLLAAIVPHNLLASSSEPASWS